MSQPEKFQNNLLELIDLVKETVSWLNQNGYETKVSPFTISLGKAFVSTWDPNETIHTFIERSYEHWDRVQHKEEEFLTSNAEILFSGVSKEHISSFTEIFRLKENVDGKEVSVIPPETKDSIWEILHAMIRISIRHIHLTRKPELNDNSKMAYTVKYFPHISVRKNVEKWKVIL